MFFSSKEEMVNNFFSLAKENKVEISDKFGEWLIDKGFFDAPASTKYHGNYLGGLYDHSRRVFDRLVWLTDNNKLEWERPQSPFIIGMFHDLCKFDNYLPVVENEYIHEGNKLVMSSTVKQFDYNKDTIIKGHATKSIMLLSQFMILTQEEMLCIRFHMGAYGNETEQKDEWAAFDKAIHKYPNVLWTHMADMLASKVDDI